MAQIMDCNGKQCTQARAEALKHAPEIGAWLVRATHLRFCEDIAAAIMAETCPDCLGVVEGSAPGTREAPALRDDSGRFLPGARMRYTFCQCAGVRVDHRQLPERHGLAGIFRGYVEDGTGRPHA